MDLPPGYGNGESVWLLLKGLYGLKQARRIWHKQLKADMEGLGYVQCPRNYAVFRIGTGVGACYQLDCIAEMFRQKYSITGEGELRWTLGITVKHNYSSRTISLSQESYVDTFIEHFGLKDACTVTTPLAPGAIYMKDQCLKTPGKIEDMAGNSYRELISSLQYVSLATHPDVTFTVSKFA
jgi:Reverse transcriptase (RNA-dependent DNA polymerase)